MPCLVFVQDVHFMSQIFGIIHDVHKNPTSWCVSTSGLLEAKCILSIPTFTTTFDIKLTAETGASDWAPHQEQIPDREESRQPITRSFRAAAAAGPAAAQSHPGFR